MSSAVQITCSTDYCGLADNGYMLMMALYFRILADVVTQKPSVFCLQIFY